MSRSRNTRKMTYRLNQGKSKMYPPAPYKHRHQHSTCGEGQIGMEELAEMFFCSIMKISKFRKLGIIKEETHAIKGKMYCFNREETIVILSKYVREDGQLTLSDRKKRKDIGRTKKKPK